MTQLKWLLFIAIGIILFNFGAFTSLNEDEQKIIETISHNRLVRSPGKKDEVKKRKEIIKRKKKKGRQSKNKKRKGQKQSGRKNNGNMQKTKISQKLKVNKRNRENKPRKVKKGKRKKTKGNRKSKGKNTLSRQSATCSGTTPVTSTCLDNAKNVLVYEETQVTNYLKQSKQLIRHGAQADSKRGKKGEFVHAAEHMMMAIGGNISAPICGKNDTDATTRNRQQRALDLHLENYEKLMNCSAAIQEACTVPPNAYNETALVKIKACNSSMEEYRTFTKSCQTNAMKNNATGQCECWAQAKTKMDAIKKQKCSINNEKKQVTAEKRKCVKAFGKCKKMEDQSVELIHVCMNDHSMKFINMTAESLHASAMGDTSKELASADDTAKDIISGNADTGKQFDNDPYNDND